MELLDREMREHLIERLTERKNRGGLKGVHQLDPETGKRKYYTPDDQINEARKGTPFGIQLLLAEKTFEEFLKKRM